MSVSLKNIASVLQETADIGTCCTSSHINKWSFHKPINNESLTQITTQDYYDANDGFYLYTYSSMSSMLYELQHPETYNIWKYTARTAPYRLTDFEDYSHYSSQLCTLTWETDNGGTPGSTLRLYCTDFENMISHWAYFEGVRSYVDIVLLFYPSGTTFNQGGTTGFYVYKVKSIMDYDGGGNINFRIPNNMSAGQYEMRMCLSTATTGMSDGETYYYNQSNPLYGTTYALPHHTQQVFTVNSSGGGGGGSGTSDDFFNYLTFDFYYGSWEFSPDSYVLSNISFTNLITIGSSTNKTFNVSISYYYENALPNRVLLGSANRTLNEDDQPWANIQINYRDNIYVVTEADLDEKLPVTCEVAVTVNNTTQRKTFTTTILLDQ